MGRRLLIFGLVALAAFGRIHVAAAQSTTQPPFPHLGAILVGGNIDFASVPHIGNMGATIWSAYPGYSMGGKTWAQHVTAVKALNPNIKITGQVDIMAMWSYEMSAGAALYPMYAAVDPNNWWLRSAYPSGSIVTTVGADAVNIASPNRTSSGQTYRQWSAAFAASFITAVAPNADGINTDNFFYQPRVDGDYLQNGTTQSVSSIAQNWRNAYADWATQLKAAMGPGYMAWGNVADWYQGSIQGYDQILNGGVFEGAVGASYSPENLSWAKMMNAYSIMMQALAPFQGSGPYLIFGQQTSATDYQSLRYGLGSCLLDNGYISVNPSGGYSSFAWFDEFGVDLGAPVSGPNNPNNGTYSSGGLTVWQNGVWRRDFANGIALVNPKGNGPQTVTLETTYKHFSGTQAPSVNNGQSVTSVTLNDRDGVILLRLSSQTSQPAVPNAPTIISVQ